MFDVVWLDREQRYADADVYALLRQQADHRLQRLESTQPVAERIHHLIVHHYHAVPPDMRSLARRLGMSERSLRRRLAEEGTQFSDVLRRGMAELACNILVEPATSIQEAAYRLGFAEVSSFYRAFKHWTGKTPRAYCEEQGLS